MKRTELALTLKATAICDLDFKAEEATVFLVSLKTSLSTGNHNAPSPVQSTKQLAKNSHFPGALMKRLMALLAPFGFRVVLAS
jgi:hypothetical protein